MSVATNTLHLPAVERRGSLLELVGPVGLGILGVLHAAWALGWRWPGGSDDAWAERLSGSTELPSVTATWGMAVGLLGAAGAVATANSHTLRPGRVRKSFRLAAWGIAAGLLGRAAFFLPSDLTGDTGIFGKLDLAVYAPTSAVLGISIAGSLRRTAGKDPPDDHG